MTDRAKVLPAEQRHCPAREGTACWTSCYVETCEVLRAMQDGDVIVFDDGIIVERIGNEWEVDCPDD